MASDDSYFAGRIGRSNVSVGAAVGPATGPLVSIVSQDPMQVTFPVAVKSFLELQRRCADKGGLTAVRVRLKLTDGSQTRMFPEVEQHLLDVTMSRNGRYVVFGRAATSPQLPLVIKDTVSNTESVYNPQEARAGVRSPSISPDGTRVIFGQSAPGGQQIASVDMKAGDLRFLTRAAGINTHPHFSPDGKQIVFSSSREGDFEIYVMQADGSDVRRLTTSPGMDSHPHWSPDGRRISFTSRRDGNYEIYLMNRDGSEPRNLTNHPERDDFSAWHPSGKQLVTVSERRGEYNLYLFDVPEAP